MMRVALPRGDRNHRCACWTSSLPAWLATKPPVAIVRGRSAGSAPKVK